MKILLISIGTRGDMDPFLAIGNILKEKGHEVLCAFPELFRNLAEESNIEFASLGKKYTKLLNSDGWKAFMGGSSTGLRKLFSLISLGRESSQTNKELIVKQYEIIKKERPDRILYNGKSNYPIIWEINNRGKTILVSPVPFIHYVKGHTHLAFHSNFGPFNKLTYSFAEFGLVIAIKIPIKWLDIQRRIAQRKIKKIISSRKVIYTIRQLNMDAQQ